MSAVVLQCSHVFGLRKKVANSLSFFDKQTIIFPSGNNCVCYNIDEKCQKFIPGLEKSQGMYALALSPNHRFLAVSERDERASITVYDLQYEPCRKRKVLAGGDVPVQVFVSMAFSADAKYLVGQAGAPDWTLFFWLWQKQKVMATVETGGASNPIYQVSFNPYDSMQVCVSGKGTLKIFRYTEGTLKPSTQLKLDAHNILSHAWVSEERVIAGTEMGFLLVFESGHLQWDMSVSNKDTEEDHQEPNYDETVSPQLPSVTVITAYSKGFACSAGPGTVCLFEKTIDRDKDNYCKTKELKIPQDQCRVDPNQAQQQQIECMVISPLDEILVCSTELGQLYSINLSSAEISKKEQAQFEYLCHSFHSAAITGLSICIRKPIIATCSLDRTVRIWSFMTNTLELCKEFQTEAHSIALHPSGLFVLVGFADKLRLMNLLSDDIRTFKEFTVRACGECAFSHGGHMFAAVNRNIYSTFYSINIYSTITFENLLNLKGHNGMVCSVVWSEDDSRLISCGMEGAVYEWNTWAGKRESECVLKTCSYTGVTVSADKSVFVVGTDCTLKEIRGCEVFRELPAADVVYTTITITRSGRMLFAGTSAGTIRAIKYPLPTQGDWVEYQAHAAPVSKMAVTFDDRYLLTVSEDGSLFVWKIIDKEGTGDKEIFYTEEILITKSDLEEKNQIMQELNARMELLKLESQDQLCRRDMNANKTIKELTEQFCQKIKSLQINAHILKVEKENMEKDHQGLMNDTVEKHDRDLQELESVSNRKLQLEYQKYQELLEKVQQMQADNDKVIQDMEEAKTAELEELNLRCENKTQETLAVLEKCQEDSRVQLEEFEEWKRQMEEDGDSEILDLRIRSERLLKEAREINLRLMDDTGIMKKRVCSLQREIDDKNIDIERMKAEQQKLQTIIKSQERNILGLKKEIQEIDETVQDKERHISNLTKKNQEQQKIKFVQDHKIQELQKQIEPRENDIKEMKEQIKQMEKELDTLDKSNTQQELNITNLQMKLSTTNKKMHEEEQRKRNVETLLGRFKADLHNCVGFIQQPKRLKDNIRELHDRYVQQSGTMDTDVVDAQKQDVQKEHSRQRDHLEKTISSLMKKLSEEQKLHQTNKVRMMKENRTLISEINDLRKELKVLHSQVHNYKIELSCRGKPSALLPQRTPVSHDSGSGSEEEEEEEESEKIQLSGDPESRESEPSTPSPR